MERGDLKYLPSKTSENYSCCQFVMSKKAVNVKAEKENKLASSQFGPIVNNAFYDENRDMEQNSRSYILTKLPLNKQCVVFFKT